MSYGMQAVTGIFDLYLINIIFSFSLSWYIHDYHHYMYYNYMKGTKFIVDKTAFKYTLPIFRKVPRTKRNVYSKLIYYFFIFKIF